MSVPTSAVDRSSSVDPASSALGEQDHGSGVDRRRSVRERQATPAWLSAPSGGVSNRLSSGRSAAGQQVLVTDLSLHGVGFRSSSSLNLGDACWIVISGTTLRVSTRLRVRSCRRSDDGRSWVVGGEFF